MHRFKGIMILSTTDLTKKYEQKTVVSDINLSLGGGEIFALTGPNGSRK